MGGPLKASLNMRIEVTLIDRLKIYACLENSSYSDIVAGLIRDHVPDLVVTERTREQETTGWTDSPNPSPPRASGSPGDTN